MRVRARMSVCASAGVCVCVCLGVCVCVCVRMCDVTFISRSCRTSGKTSMQLE